MCDIAEVSRSGYYRTSQSKDYNDYLLIKEIFEKGKGRLGWRPIQMRLRVSNIIMNHKKIQRIKNKYNMITKIRRKNPYRMIMKKTQEHRIFNNVLNRNFNQSIVRRYLCTDITYLYYGYQKAYLSVIKDIATKEILAWKLSRSLTMEFVLDSIDSIGMVDKEALIHSDQGVHYTHPEYVERVKNLGLIQSMSRKGNCIDNAPIESFFGHLKDDMEYRDVETFDELNSMVDKYMNYYNKERYQWGIKKMTPVQYRNHLLSCV